MPDGSEVNELIHRALALHKSGRLDEAADLYKKVLRQQPEHADALHLLGLTTYQTGELEVAAALIERAIAHCTPVASYHCSLGEVLKDQGKLEDALAALDEAIRLDAELAQAHDSRGTILRILARPEDSLAAHDRALEINPDSPEILNNRGVALMDLGRLTDALDAFDRALLVNADIAEIHSGRGNCLVAAGDMEGALAAFERAIEIDPAHADALNGRGAALWNMGQHDDALSTIDECIHLNPDHAQAHNNRGTVLRDLGQVGNALTAFEKAISLRPNFAQAHSNRGSVLKDQARIEDSLAACRRALEIDPDFAEAHSNYLFCLNYDPSADDQMLFQAHRDWGAKVSRQTSVFTDHANARDPDKVLRVGLVSNDFGRHPVGYLTDAVLTAANPERLQFLIYSGAPKEDDLSERLRQHAHAWRSTIGLPDQALSEAVRADDVDILMDLSGHTAGNRLMCFASKPAPVQVSWLGYCHTTGLPAIDYVLADPTYVPKGGERWFTEKVLRLPHTRWCYAPPEYAPEVAKPPVLDQEYITFGSFNNLTKVNGEVISVWAKILHAIPKSQLMLSWKTLADPSECTRLRKAFRAQGIAGERIVFTSGGDTHAKVLGQYNDVDIALDPFPFCGGLTSCEALWMGVPVVTLPDTRPASRQSLGMLTALNRTEWIAESRDDYVSIAADLARNPSALQAAREDQRGRMATSPLCDGELFANDFEAALREMWQQWCHTGSA